ncbi:DUF7507 domain-containing protein [Protaetiibacter larvae]|uniref:DUF7507 domain-containing protein n=1 Tax=Protaetiibacter larvae TaxID=2592654 RepID=A0A5C1Y7S1_9MICO|nr:hypothetical protein [Protaetiibacter larvae]QEO09245.1 hypothetical protein FLP23_03985 [Protaetiibacter larvae]
MRAWRVASMGVTLSAVGILLASAGSAPAATGAPELRMPVRATGPLLLDEDFTGATAIDDFRAHGDACLTGAPVFTGTHVNNDPVPGCPAQAELPGTTYPAVTLPISPPLGADGNGYLRLTDAIPDRTGAVLYEVPIQATDGVEITFEQWQYGGYSTMPEYAGRTADGISFFLVDGDATLLAPGAFGGSLGYAQKLPDNDPGETLVDGVVGGYLGIGLDVLGNFFGDWEQRGAGCTGAGASPAGAAFLDPPAGQNMVTVRGPVGASTAVGYCFLTASYVDDSSVTPPFSSTLPGALHGALMGPVPTDPAAAVAFLEPAKRIVTIVLEPEPTHNVTVYVDFGSGPQQVLFFHAPEPVPASVKFGFAASTGAFTDVHLIRTMRVQALDPVPALSLTKTGVPLVPGPQSVGDQIRYDFLVSNVGGGTITGIVVHDDTVGPVTCPQPDLAEGESMTCWAYYTLTQEDLERGEVLNTAFATGDGRDGEVTSNTDDERVDLRALANGGADGAALAAVGAAALLTLLIGAVIVARRRSQGAPS